MNFTKVFSIITLGLLVSAPLCFGIGKTKEEIRAEIIKNIEFNQNQNANDHKALEKYTELYNRAQKDAAKKANQEMMDLTKKAIARREQILKQLQKKLEDLI